MDHPSSSHLHLIPTHSPFSLFHPSFPLFSKTFKNTLLCSSPFDPSTSSFPGQLEVSTVLRLELSTFSPHSLLLACLAFSHGPLLPLNKPTLLYYFTFTHTTSKPLIMQIKTLTALALASLVSAQTYTDCDPTKKSMFHTRYVSNKKKTVANLTASFQPAPTTRPSARRSSTSTSPRARTASSAAMSAQLSRTTTSSAPSTPSRRRRMLLPLAAPATSSLARSTLP